MSDRDELAELVRQYGFTEGVSPHSWRCDNPDRFPGYCTCVTDLADALTDWLAKHDAEVAATAVDSAKKLVMQYLTTAEAWRYDEVNEALTRRAAEYRRKTDTKGGE